MTTRPPDPHDPANRRCGSTRHVQMGPMSAIDLHCQLAQWQHETPQHLSARDFEDVRMVARWPGAFEPPE